MSSQQRCAGTGATAEHRCADADRERAIRWAAAPSRDHRARHLARLAVRSRGTFDIQQRWRLMSSVAHWRAPSRPARVRLARDGRRGPMCSPRSSAARWRQRCVEQTARAPPGSHGKACPFSCARLPAGGVETLNDSVMSTARVTAVNRDQSLAQRGHASSGAHPRGGALNNGLRPGRHSGPPAGIRLRNDDGRAGRSSTGQRQWLKRGVISGR
jgi:hypothetical protein